MTKVTPDDWHIIWCVPNKLGSEVYDLSTGEVLGAAEDRGGVLLDVDQSDWTSGAEQTYNGFSDKLLGVRKKNLEPNLKIMFPRDAVDYMKDQRFWWDRANSFQYAGTLRVKTNVFFSGEPVWREAEFRLKDMNLSYEYHPGVIFKQREADAWMLTSEDLYWKRPTQWAEFSNKVGEAQVIKKRSVTKQADFMLHPAKGEIFDTLRLQDETDLFTDSVVPVWPEIDIVGPLKSPIGIKWTQYDSYDITLFRDIAAGEIAHIVTDPRKRYAWIENGEILVDQIKWSMHTIEPAPGQVRTFFVWSGENSLNSESWQSGNVKIKVTTYHNTPF